MIPWQTWTHSSSAGFTLRGVHSPPSGKPVIHFIHGNGFCGRTYEPLMLQLSPYFDLFLSDIQGHGASDKGEKFLGWNASAALCAEAWFAHRNQFGSQPAFALGHSFGGVLSALIMGQHPRLFERAVLLDPVLFPPSMIGLIVLSDVVGLLKRNIRARRARKRRACWPDRNAAYAYLHQRGMFKGWSDDALWAYVNHGLKNTDDNAVCVRCAPEFEADIFASFPQKLWSYLKKVEIPTKVLYGEHTFPFVPKGAVKWQTAKANVNIQQISGGHCFMQEDPSHSAALIRAFLLNF